jgi:hypothetical protein
MISSGAEISDKPPRQDYCTVTQKIRALGQNAYNYAMQSNFGSVPQLKNDAKLEPPSMSPPAVVLHLVANFKVYN